MKRLILAAFLATGLAGAAHADDALKAAIASKDRAPANAARDAARHPYETLTFFGIMRELSASILLYSVGSEVLSVVLLRMWENGQAETVSVIGLMMMLLVFVFRWVQLRLIKRYISTL